MITVRDNRPTDITVEEDDEVVIRYLWVDGSSTKQAAEVIQKRLIEMGEEDTSAIALANLVRAL